MTDRKVSSCEGADGGGVNGSDGYEDMPRSERPRISGWDSRKAANSGLSLEHSLNFRRLGKR